MNGVKLTELIRGLDITRVHGDAGAVVASVAFDSRVVEPGDIFVAVPGAAVDGHDYAAAAVERGATAVIAEHKLAINATQVIVPSAAQALAHVAARFYGNPAAHLRMCGVTGTNGKTTVAHMLRSIVDESGLGKMGIVGTLGHGVRELVKTAHTTPDAVTLHRLFRDMADEGCFGVVMEVSSHAVRQHRTWGLNFEVGIITNVTHDHLDYHSDFADYRAAKAEFCNSLAAPERQAPGTLVYWCDDPVAREIGESFPARAIPVGTGEDTSVRVSDIDTSLDGTRFTLHVDGESLPVETNLLGAFVAVNAALAAAAAHELGAEASVLSRGLAQLDAVPGRFEALGGSGRPVVIIDYAHTADAMESVLETCRALGPQRVHTVFGCGGDRDRGKRAPMGEIAERLSDAVTLTTDNPRGENVLGIISDIRAGMTGDVEVEFDRASAVRRAIAGAGPRDLVALLGKGAEHHQIVGEETVPYSERDEAEKALSDWGSR